MELIRAVKFMKTHIILIIFVTDIHLIILVQISFVINLVI